MFKRLTLLGAVLVTGGMVAATTYVVSPTKAHAATAPVYSAGTWNAPICKCPVLVGGCVCQIGSAQLTE